QRLNAERIAKREGVVPGLGKRDGRSCKRQRRARLTNELDPGKVGEDLGEERVVRAGFLERPFEELPHPRQIVPTHIRDGIQSLYASGAGLELGEHRLVQLACATSVPGGEQVPGGKTSTTQRPILVLGWRDRGSQLVKLGGDMWRAPCLCL